MQKNTQKSNAQQIRDWVSSYHSVLQLDVPKLLIPILPTQINQIYNRSQTHLYLRGKGFNPYNYTGELRKALRMVLNNLATDNDKTIVLGMGIFKKGGKALPSRNPVVRFKMRGEKAKFFREGGLLTSIKTAEIPKYQQGSYIVKRGDTLSSIAKKNGMSLQQILSFNKGINPDLIQIGQKINLGNNTSTSRPSTNPSTPYRNRLIATIEEAELNNAAKLWGKLTIEQAKLRGAIATTQSKQIREQIRKERDKSFPADKPVVIVDEPKQETENQHNIFDFISAPGYNSSFQNNVFNNYGQKIINNNPALALVNRKVHGILGLNVNYTSIPLDQIDILSDQNQYIYDNWKDAMNYNLGVLNNTLSENQQMLKTGFRKEVEEDGTVKYVRLSEKEMNELLQTIENNKNSISSLRTAITNISKAGGLENYLKANPGLKVVIGGNFRFYKDRNKTRFGLNTPSGYANFEDPYYVSYSMSTPLGKVESTYGNNVLSFVYDPLLNQILTRVSDEYDFNKKGTESESQIAKLRAKAGNDTDLSNRGSVKYSVLLKPIKLDGSKNYTTNFGNVTRQNTWLENYLLEKGIKYYENK